MTVAAVVTGPRTRHVEHCMGTVFSIDVRGPGEWSDAFAAVVSWLHRVDEVFSPFKPGSDVSRLARGELRLADADPEVRVVLDLCAEVSATTGGYFTPLVRGHIDPTGLVKGWAVERASELLRRHGSTSHAVNGGGDVQLAGEAAPGRPWAVGIVDPRDRTRLLTTVEGRDLAVASSGVAERGAHIRDPFTGRAAIGLAGASVVGPSLTRADAYATAAFVMGHDAVRWIETVPDYAALVVTPDGHCATSAGWAAPGA